MVGGRRDAMASGTARVREAAPLRRTILAHPRTPQPVAVLVLNVAARVRQDGGSRQSAVEAQLEGLCAAAGYRFDCHGAAGRGDRKPVGPAAPRRRPYEVSCCIKSGVKIRTAV